ncbi:MAG: TIGR00282 family metallophosphoesterase [Clostridia bacterium]|nr:TIGR00282 family metallophosphoesterase [Clostridia bacterium]
MKILAIGDIVGKAGVEFLRSKLPSLKKEYEVDFVIANGENSAEGNGIVPISANKILNAGVNVITGGNHTFRRREIFPYLNENQRIIRPINYPSESTPGVGMRKFKVRDIPVCVINLIGVAYMECVELPITAIDRALESCRECKIKVVDFHAEATAEKRALGYYLDGRVSAVFGTHTHVQTSDDCILPNGTGYITDVGMTGVIHSVLGVKKEISIRRMKDRIPVRFENAYGACKMECIIFDIDEETGHTRNVERLRVL